MDGIDPLAADARAVGLARQAMSADLVVRGDGWERGVRSVLLQNDRIALDVVLDRGMDIAGARIRGVPVAWLSPTGIVGPWYVENSGRGPHRSFFGGLLKTCGLDHIGAPREGPDAASPSYPLHGRISSSPAQLKSYGVEERSGELIAFVEGVATQAGVFAETLILHRRISIAFGSGIIELTDVVSNEGMATVDNALLYHINLGWPIAAPGACLRLPDRQLRGDRTFSEVLPPQNEALSRVWHFDASSGPWGPGSAGIYHPVVDATRSIGVKVLWEPAQLPTLVHWQMSGRAGQYAVALEPSTIMPASVAGPMQFPKLEPGERKTFDLRIELRDGPNGADPLAPYHADKT